MTDTTTLARAAREAFNGDTPEHMRIPWASLPQPTIDRWHRVAEAVIEAAGPSLPDPATTPQPGAFHTHGQTTERQAYERLAKPKAGTLREQALNVFYRYRHTDGLTDGELASLMDRYLYSVAPRRTELYHMGWVENSGVTRPTGNGAQAVVWRLTDEGRELWGRERIRRA